jgi:Starch-binding associating with outer membrane
MRNYKRNDFRTLATVFVCALGMASCTKKLETINIPPTGAPNTTLNQLYVAFISNMALSGGDLNDDNGWLYPIAQQGMVYTHPDFPYASTGIWGNYYHNLANYNVYMQLIAASPDSALYANVKAMLMVLRAYQTIKVSDFYGDIPFSAAGKVLDRSNNANLTPSYDKQQSVYVACLKDLETAVNSFNTTDPKQYSLGSNDLVLVNNIPQWIKFANSLRLRFALNIYDKDPTDATPQIADALTKPLLSDYTTDNIGLYPANIPNEDLSARNYTFGTECRLRMGTTMWEQMSATNNPDGSGIFDPRCIIFFEPNNAGQWVPYPQNPTSTTPAEGGDPYNALRTTDWANKNGTGSTVNLYANFNYYWGLDKTIPDLFITAAEVHFLKAEIYNRGLAGIAANPATAATEYNAGIEASINFWTAAAINSPVWVVNKPTGLPTPAALTAFETNPAVLYDMTNTTHATSQIYAQEWIDMIRQPWDAWTLLKRTGGLTPMDPNNASYYTTTFGGYNRYQYPGSEPTYNYANWFAETNGSDLISTKIWIAK